MEISHSERVEYETKILEAEMDTVRISRRAASLRSLIRQPEEPGAYVGDSFYPVGGTQASHEWDGEEWQWVV